LRARGPAEFTEFNFAGKAQVADSVGFALSFPDAETESERRHLCLTPDPDWAGSPSINYFYCQKQRE
jgi:hypothetical protein